MPNPGSSTACLFTASLRASSLHCEPLGSQPTHSLQTPYPVPPTGTACLFSPSPRAACLSSATSFPDQGVYRIKVAYSVQPMEQPAYRHCFEHAPYSGQTLYTIQTTEQATFIIQHLYTVNPSSSKKVQITNSEDQKLYSVLPYVAYTCEQQACLTQAQGNNSSTKHIFNINLRYTDTFY